MSAQKGSHDATRQGGDDEGYGYNPNYFASGDEKLTLLHYNRRALIQDLLADDAPSFEVDEHGTSEVHLKKHPTDQEIDGGDLKWLQTELKRRGFLRPPYVLHDGAGEHTIGKDMAGTIIHGKASDALVATAGNGLPKVGKLNEDQCRLLLKQIAHDPRHKDGAPVVQPAFYQRSCQNILCVLLFLVYWAAMVVLMIVVVFSPYKGDPYKLIRPIDYQGDTCQSVDATSYSMTNQKYDRPAVVFPRLAEDALAIYQQVQSNLNAGSGDDGSGNCATSAEGCFYGICVKTCPSPGDVVCNYPTELQLDNYDLAHHGVYSGDAVTDQIKGLANARMGCWYVNLALTEILGRCIPWEPPTQTLQYDCVITTSAGEARVPITECGPADRRKPIGPDPDQGGCNQGQVEEELLRCEGVVEEKKTEIARYDAGTQDMTKQFSGAAGLISRSGKDIWHARWAIISGGFFAATLISFAFIVTMSIFAWIIVWVTLWACWFFIFLGMVLFFNNAGMLDDIIKTAIDKSNLSPNASIVVSASEGVDAFLAQTSGGDANTDEEAATQQLLWQVLSWVFLALFVIYPILLCVLRTRINLAIELVKEAGKSIMKMKLIVFYPIWTWLWLLLAFIYFVVVTTYIFTTTLTEEAVKNAQSEFSDIDTSNLDSLYTGVQDASEIVAMATNGTVDDGNRISLKEIDQNQFVKVLFVFHLFGFLWLSETIKGLGILTVAGAISTDYWIDKNSQFVPSMPVLGAAWRAFRYHFGSAIFGGAILALVRLARYVAMYVDSKTAELQKNYLWVRIVMKVVHCCLWCLEKCLRFLITSAYILVAIEGRGFCLSAWRSFKLLFSNSLRVATTVAISKIIIVLARLGIIAACMVGTYTALSELEVYGPDSSRGLWVDHPAIPTLLAGLMSIFVTGCFMDVYDTAIQTLLLSFCLDEDKFKNGLYKKKLDAQGNADPRMFCEVNSKSGLMQMVNGGSKKEGKAEAKKQQSAKDKHEDTKDSKGNGPASA